MQPKLMVGRLIGVYYVCVRLRLKRRIYRAQRSRRKARKGRPETEGVLWKGIMLRQQSRGRRINCRAVVYNSTKRREGWFRGIRGIDRLAQLKDPRRSTSYVKRENRIESRQRNQRAANQLASVKGQKQELLNDRDAMTNRWSIVSRRWDRYR